MIVFDIESGRIEAPAFNQITAVTAPLGTDALRPDMTLPVPRLMTLEEALWTESRRSGVGAGPYA